jgi:hypothetical protein
MNIWIYTHYFKKHNEARVQFIDKAGHRNLGEHHNPLAVFSLKIAFFGRLQYEHIFKGTYSNTGDEYRLQLLEQLVLRSNFRPRHARV